MYENHLGNIDDYYPIIWVIYAPLERHSACDLEARHRGRAPDRPGEGALGPFSFGAGLRCASAFQRPDHVR